MGTEAVPTCSMNGQSSSSVACCEQMDDKLDALIENLVGVGGTKRNADLSEEDVFWLIERAKIVLLKDPVLLELSAPMNVCGDLHGQFFDLLRLFAIGGLPPSASYLFMGDYVDRGRHNLKTICLLLSYKCRYPDRIYLLRGNHETSAINKIYGFYDEINKKYKNRKMWIEFNECFNCLPVAAVISNSIFCCHGGLSPDLVTLDDIKSLDRPSSVPKVGLMCDLLWADPNPQVGTYTFNNQRGISVFFGPGEVTTFLETNKLILMCRGHQLVEKGYEFFSHGKLVTIFSAPNYCGEFVNKGAFMSVDESLHCKFHTIC